MQWYRIALAFENLTPIQVCQAFGQALDRPCRYVFDQHIDIRVPVPHGYKQQLAGIEVLFGQFNAPYFPGPEFNYSSRRQGSGDTVIGWTGGEPIHHDGSDDSDDSGDSDRDVLRDRGGRPTKLTQEARQLWAGYRGIEEYAREVFPVEEEANGKTWMIDKNLCT